MSGQHYIQRFLGSILKSKTNCCSIFGYYGEVKLHFMSVGDYFCRTILFDKAQLQILTKGWVFAGY